MLVLIKSNKPNHLVITNLYSFVVYGENVLIIGIRIQIINAKAEAAVDFLKFN
jgi:hypothetical protein